MQEIINILVYTSISYNTSEGSRRKIHPIIYYIRYTLDLNGDTVYLG